MPDRPAKLSPLALLVVWGAKTLTLGEKVVWYHDWTLDQGREDGSYISHSSMSARLGGSLTAATVSKIRQRLKRLTLHEPLRRRDARNLGWVSTLPRQCVPRTYHEAAALGAVLDTYLRQLTAWSERDGPDGTKEADPTVQDEQTPRSSSAADLGGRGEDVAFDRMRETQLPSAVREKRVGAHAPETEKRVERDPAIVRAEGMALIHLAQNKKLTPEEQQLVRGWLKRQPPERQTAEMRKALGL